MTPLIAIETESAEATASSAASASPRPQFGGVSGGGVHGIAVSRPKFTFRRSQGRVLAVADGVAVSAVLAVVLATFGKWSGGVATVVGLGLCLLICLLGRRYEPEALSPTRSTLDQAPSLLMLSGMSTLAITIVVPALVPGELVGRQVAILWFSLFAAIATSSSLSRMIRGLGVWCLEKPARRNTSAPAWRRQKCTRGS